MLAGALRKGLRVVRGTAESLPFADNCVDVVTAATAFHWFDHEKALPEMRRVLAPSGRLGLLTNIRDESASWVGALSEIIGSEAAMAVTIGDHEDMVARYIETIEGAGLFRSTEHRVFDYGQELRPEDLVGLVRSRSYIALLPEDEREQLLESVAELCRTHPDLRDRHSFVMPYRTRAFRSWAS